MSLPLKAKVSIRDNWEKHECRAQESMKKLKDVLGLEVHCEPQWQILVSELESFWEDKGELVSSVASFIHVWFEALTDLLDDESHEAWTDTLLTKVRELTSRLNLTVEVSENQRPSTKWSNAQLGFILYIPKDLTHQAAQYFGLFKEQLLECFEENRPSKTLPIHSTTGDEWADVGAEDREEEPAKPPPTGSKTPAIDYLPDPNTLPKPSALFQQAPYHLFVYTSLSSRSQKIEIECSHSQTLEVMAEYLKKWTMTIVNRTDKPPAVEITLNHAASGFGLECDKLTLHCENRYGPIYNISAAAILNLVEGVFGYERVYGDSTSWHYRRDTPFKKRERM
ncbi:cytochrome family 51 (sterol 14-demethylase) [Fusarium tjaetaba]|uniref:Cytochrome family 51 (Sterol 14-demethylase) n=1 Tax=Fusarium tjaetaba TaxID=1567544 RepID=A0A8H5S8B9_9HYPO|nr:cytochrome family 51 (sterol 14-demethylase) [Fusarium tjaetaba]KAF5648685.1 cytochrome family 51 (sterol 14-demethylase) [Fusarium tjaetaba]